MPTGNLPSSGKKLWEKVYQESKGEDCDDECAARKAWSAVKSAGWSKNESGEWHKKADIASFSMIVKKASQDPITGEMRWRADTSDTGDDLAQDNMTLELFSDFVQRINLNQEAPVEFQSEFWRGGMPYLSLSHYTDHDGSAVPGMPTAVYVDGSFLKAKGILHDTPLGRACWKSLKEDLTINKSEEHNPVQISIGFIDWGHIHKSNGYKFMRETVDDVCPECFLSLMKGKAPGNRSFVKGQLVHLALTRVPMNQRTAMLADDMETKGDLDMTTRVEDAASIVGEELAAELEAEAKSVNKALVVKSETDPAVLQSILEQLNVLKVEFTELKAKHMMDKPMDEEDEEEDDEEMKKKANLEELKSAFTEALAPLFADLGQRIDIVSTALADKSRVGAVPERRSINAVPNAGMEPTTPPSNKLRDVVRRSVGLG